MNKLRLVLGLQLLVFAAWGGWLLVSRGGDSPEFYLETSPVDPHDLISGTFVALDYGISTLSPEPCQRLLAGDGPFFVRLEDRGRTAATKNGPVPVYEATGCAAQAGQGYGWVRAEPVYLFGGRRSAGYGIERFFLNENDPRRNARSGAVVAKVKITGGRRLALLDLVEKI